MKRIFFLAYFVLAAALCLTFAPCASPQGPPIVVKAKLVLSTDAVHPGAAERVAVVADISPGYHINDHHPSLDYLIPTELKLDPTKTFTLQGVSYPKGKPTKFVFSDTPLSVYEGKIEIGATLAVAHGAAPGEYPVRGKLEYQACNDHACLPPASVPLALTVKVVRSRVPVHRINSDIFRNLGAE